MIAPAAAGPTLRLPIPPTPFIGREREVAQVQALLQDPAVRLLTLTGPGGTGKTRLALQTAAALANVFPDGIYFVRLTPIADPRLVMAAVAEELGVREAADQPLIPRLHDALHDQTLLLVLDNFEQVVAAAPEVAALLAGAPRVKALITSRQRLHLYGEQEFPVPPLGLPDVAHLPPLEQLTQYEAIRLFIARAQAVRPDFQVTDETAPILAQICVRLDGLPLAIELAAARIKLFAVPALLLRLERRLPMLTGGSRDLPLRHQTLRNAIAWSYDLLTPAEQLLFRRLAVFRRGCTLEAAEAVCNPAGDLGLDMLDGLFALLNQSLLRQVEQDDGEPRFFMLATIREYALERLTEYGEIAALEQQHAAFFLTLARQAATRLHGPEQRLWAERLDQEQDNLRAALLWAWTDVVDPSISLRLVIALSPYWAARGHFTEGRRWADAAVARQGEIAPVLRAGVLNAAGGLTLEQGDLPQAAVLLEESLALHRRLGDPEALAQTLKLLGTVRYMAADTAGASALYAESLALWRAQGNQEGIATMLNNLGVLAYVRGEYSDATRFYLESLNFTRQMGDQRLIANVLANMGEIAQIQGDYMRATALYEDCLALREAIGSKPGIAHSYGDMAKLAQLQHDYPRAVALARQSLALHEEVGNNVGRSGALARLGELAYQQQDLAEALRLLRESLALAQKYQVKRRIVECLNELATVQAAQRADAEGALWAARLFGAAAALQAILGTPLIPTKQAEQVQRIAALQQRVTAPAWDAAWAEGAALPLDDAIALALQELPGIPSAPPAPRPPPPPVPPPAPPAPALAVADLTARELEVLRLVAQGLSNAEVAERLTVSPRTVQAHLYSVFGKIGVTSRAGATRYALEHKLV